jgi:hypothetical protein
MVLLIFYLSIWVMLEFDFRLALHMEGWFSKQGLRSFETAELIKHILISCKLFLEFKLRSCNDSWLNILYFYFLYVVDRIYCIFAFCMLGLKKVVGGVFDWRYFHMDYGRMKTSHTSRRVVLDLHIQNFVVMYRFSLHLISCAL